MSNLQAFNAGVQATPNATMDNFDGDDLDNVDDADPNDASIDWHCGVDPSFIVIELNIENIENVDELRLADFTEQGTLYFKRWFLQGWQISNMIVDRGLVAQEFPLEPQSEGQFGALGDTLVGERVPGTRIVNGYDEECLWDSLDDTFTAWQCPTGYHDDLRDERGGLLLGTNWRTPYTPGGGLRRSPDGTFLPGDDVIGLSNARIEANGNIATNLAYWHRNPVTGDYDSPTILPATSAVCSATLLQSPEGEQAHEWNLVAGSNGNLMVSRNQGAFQKTSATGSLAEGQVTSVTRQGWAVDGTTHRIWANGHWHPLTELLGIPAPDGAELLGILDTGLAVVKINHWNAPSRLAILLPIGLDVNGDGDLDDSCDRLDNYLPGYELDEAKLHGPKHDVDDVPLPASFINSEYKGPQEMNIIISGINTAMADSATFTIISSSNWPGYCGNGALPNEFPILPSPDFSFEATSDLDEISGTINGNKLSAPIYCKDYGAWCEVAITLKKGGIPIQSEPIRLRIPRDANGDKIADCWQDKQNAEWNDQFNPITPRPITPASRAMVQPDLDDEEADSDGNNGDGGRDLPAMAASGDGLKIREEYRGYILDGGPNLAQSGDHKRLSIARKELLVECSVENDLTSLDKNGAGTNQDVLSSFYFPSVLSDISSLYRDPERGVAIDLYWAKDVLVQPGAMVDYDDYFLPRGGWEYNVNYEAGTYRVVYTKTVQNTFYPVTVIGAGIPIQDRAWRLVSQEEHDDLYGDKQIGSVWVEAMQSANRNANLEAFAKLSLPTRRGYLTGGISKDAQGQDIIDPTVFRFLKDATDHSVGSNSGARVDVAALCDEGIAFQWEYTQDRHYFEWEFNPLLRQVVAHEIGHLIRQGGHYDDSEAHDTVMNGWSFYTDGRVVGISTLYWDIEEAKGIKLPARSTFR